MDEGPNRLDPGNPEGRNAILEREAAELRERLDRLLAEFDQRRWRWQGRWGRLRDIALPMLGGALAIGIVIALARWRREETWSDRILH